MSPTCVRRPCPRTRVACVTRAVIVAAMLTALLVPAAAPAKPVVVASKLDRPRGLAIAPDGTLYAALVGHGGKPCNDEGCFGATGRVVRIGADRKAHTIAGGLLSMRGLPDGFFSIGADQLALLPDGRLATAMTAEFQGDRGAPPGAIPRTLRGQVGHLIFVSPNGTKTIGPDIAAVERRDDPDGRGVVSNPYGVAAVGDAIYVSDSAGNDLLEVRGDQVSLVATFPKEGDDDPVPDALAAGPDGALYVGEYTGGSQRHGAARIWRVVPGQPPAVFAGGLTSISALAFGPDGSLYATELRLGDVVRIAPDGSRTHIAGLHDPGGIAVAADGRVYVSNWTVAGATPARKGPLKHRTGQVVLLSGP